MDKRELSMPVLENALHSWCIQQEYKHKHTTTFEKQIDIRPAYFSVHKSRFIKQQIIEIDSRLHSWGGADVMHSTRFT